MSLLVLITNVIVWLASQLSIKMLLLGGGAIILVLSWLDMAIVSSRNDNGKILRAVRVFVKKHGEIDELNIAKFVKSVGKKFPKKERRLLKLYMMSNEAYNASTMPIAISEMTMRKHKSPKLTIKGGLAAIFAVQSLMLIAGEGWATVFVAVGALTLVTLLINFFVKLIVKIMAFSNEKSGIKLEKLLSRYIVIGRGRLAPVVDLSKLDCKMNGVNTSSVNQLSRSLDSFVDSCPDKSIAQIVEQGLNNCSFGKELTVQEKDYFDRAMQRLRNFCS
ncbi:MAG: hypothetical protein ACI4M5_02545 [Christensenellales bacterium]